MYQRLGQHFLINKAAIRAIVRAVDPQDGETIVEIGPGHGELTREIKNQNAKIKIIAIEKDRRLAATLATYYAGDDDIEIIPGDALTLLPSFIHNSLFIIHNSSYKLVGNIPYYLTGRLFRVIGELPHKPRRIVFTLQREVAERLCAQPPRMNLLAASVQIWAEPRIVRRLVPADFSPAPKVESAVVKLETWNLERGTQNRERYYRLIKIIFKQPRQTIMNNLSRGLGIKKSEIQKKLAVLGVDPACRPQELSLATLNSLTTLKKFPLLISPC